MDAALLTDSLPADVTGWWVSEKYDGVRAIWTGTKLLSRHGKDLKAPAWFTDGLPKNHRLDGELWMGRGTFNALLSCLQKKDWECVRYMVFETAVLGLPFELRQSDLHFIRVPGHCHKVIHRQLSNNADLDDTEKKIVSQGGEGCVIRRPGSPYRPGRMGDVIKVKRLVSDVERWQG